MFPIVLFTTVKNNWFMKLVFFLRLWREQWGTLLKFYRSLFPSTLERLTERCVHPLYCKVLLIFWMLLISQCCNLHLCIVGAIDGLAVRIRKPRRNVSGGTKGDSEYPMFSRKCFFALNVQACVDYERRCCFWWWSCCWSPSAMNLSHMNLNKLLHAGNGLLRGMYIRCTAKYY